jgi:hypothetical protein
VTVDPAKAPFVSVGQDPSFLHWRKSSFSGNNGCVEAAPLAGNRVALRDSKDPSLGFFIYDQHEWTSFLAGVRNGEFDDLVSVPPVTKRALRRIVPFRSVSLGRNKAMNKVR